MSKLIKTDEGPILVVHDDAVAPDAPEIEIAFDDAEAQEDKPKPPLIVFAREELWKVW